MVVTLTVVMIPTRGFLRVLMAHTLVILAVIILGATMVATAILIAVTFLYRGSHVYCADSCCYRDPCAIYTSLINDYYCGEAYTGGCSNCGYIYVVVILLWGRSSYGKHTYRSG